MGDKEVHANYGAGLLDKDNIDKGTTGKQSSEHGNEIKATF